MLESERNNLVENIDELLVIINSNLPMNNKVRVLTARLPRAGFEDLGYEVPRFYDPTIIDYTRFFVRLADELTAIKTEVLIGLTLKKPVANKSLPEKVIVALLFVAFIFRFWIEGILKVRRQHE